jgi:Lhr-like helicase
MRRGIKIFDVDRVIEHESAKKVEFFAQKVRFAATPA